ncbi:hypothetical protein Vadar_013952 [Vaccinium darrowii]|uniref:Uncharacterized protein n=1 Tax=Vaccinium darrowii TaxID=229202 RepID=A0ACB7XA50_9ERIC|nr:hypothetical protein Vadar_013952 [Vaccinium darrowii]
MARRGKERNKEEEDDEEGTEEHHERKPWGTLEELLLACAVNRHGAKSWDSIAMELQKRASNASQHVYSPPNCQRRYHDLRRRFSAVDGGNDDVDTSLVDELKKLRVAELKRDVEQRDISIELLELKVKRLEEERREQGKEGSEKTDQPDELDNREPEGNTLRRERSGTAGDDNDNHSFNESNTTSYRTAENRELNGDELKDEPVSKPESNEPVNKPESIEPEPVREDVSPAEKGSLLSSEEITNVEVEKKRRRSSGSSGEDEAEEGGKPVHAKEIASKSQPLIKILVMLRSHKNGSLFERRLRSQEAEKYKKMIRQHMDLQTVQSRMDRGFYLNNNKKFFRDLFLLFTNAIIFFPTTSPHHIAALQLRQLLTKHMLTTAPSPPKRDPVHSEPEKPVAKLRQPGNNPVPHKSEPGKKQQILRQNGTNVMPKRSEPSKKEHGLLHAKPNKVGGKGERPEARPHSNRVSMGNKVVEEKSSKKQLVKERPELSRRSGRVGLSSLEREKKKSPPKEVEEDSSDEDGGGETEKEKKRRAERGRNNGRGKGGRPPCKSPVGKDIGRGKRGRREGGEPPPVVDSGRPRKRSKR